MLTDLLKCSQPRVYGGTRLAVGASQHNLHLQRRREHITDVLAVTTTPAHHPTTTASLSQAVTQHSFQVGDQRQEVSRQTEAANEASMRKKAKTQAAVKHMVQSNTYDMI